MRRPNIALIGMPGCGKSTVGKLLAKELDYGFIDADEEVVKKLGMSIPDIFSQKGEGFFRSVETEVVSQIVKADKMVIATGGGVVLRPENMAVLIERCVIIYIKRSCELILSSASHEGRPLLSPDPNKIYQLFDERKSLYEKYCDIAVENETDAKMAVREVLKELAKK